MIYVAAPYGDAVKHIIEKRIHKVEEYLAYLTFKGEHAISPLLMHHVLNKGFNLPNDFKFWGDYCLSLLKRCDKMIVLKLDGWVGSRGVGEEILFCNANDIPVEFREPL